MPLCCTANEVECYRKPKNTVYVSKAERSRILNSLKRGLETNEKRVKNRTVVQDLTVILMKLTQLRAKLYEVEQRENCKHIVLGRMMDIVKNEICEHLKKDSVEPSDVFHVVQRMSALEKLVEKTWNHVTNDDRIMKVKVGPNKSTSEANSDWEARDTVESPTKRSLTFAESGDSRPKNNQYRNEDNSKKRAMSLTKRKSRSMRSSELKDIMIKGNDRHTVGLVSTESTKRRFVKSKHFVESIKRRKSLTDGIVIEKKKSIVLDLRLGNESPGKAKNAFGILKRNIDNSKRRKVRIASTTSTEKYTVESKLESSNVIELLKSNIDNKNARRPRDNNQQSEEEGRSISKTRFSICNDSPPKPRAVETSTSYDDFILDPYFSWNNPRVADISRKKYVIDNKSWRYTESEYSSGGVSTRGTMTQVSCFPKTPANNKSCQTDTATRCEAIKQVCYLRVFYTSTYLGYGYDRGERADLIDRSDDWFVTCRTDPTKGLAHFTLIQNTMTPEASVPDESAFRLNRAKNSWLQRTHQLFRNSSDTISSSSRLEPL